VMEFRWYDEFGEALDVDHNEDLETSDLEQLNRTVKQMPLAEIAQGTDVGNLARRTDRSRKGHMKQAKMKLRTALRRSVHRRIARAFIIPKTITSAYDLTGADYTIEAFPVAYVNGKTHYSQLKTGDFFTIEDFLRLKEIMENSNVPYTDPEEQRYACLIDTSIKNQLVDYDKGFREVVKENEAMAKETFFGSKFYDYRGLRFVVQSNSEGVRVALGSDPTLAASLSTTGKVHVATILGQKAYAYLDLGKSRAHMDPPYVVKDLSLTNIQTTVTYRVPFQAGVVRPTWGINLCGLVQNDLTVDDLAA